MEGSLQYLNGGGYRDWLIFNFADYETAAGLRMGTTGHVDEIPVAAEDFIFFNIGKNFRDLIRHGQFDLPEYLYYVFLIWQHSFIIRPISCGCIGAGNCYIFSRCFLTVVG